MPPASVRFAAGLSALILGGILVLVVFAFSRGVVEAVGTGVGCATVVVALAANAAPRLGTPSRWFHALLTVVAGWTVLAARVFGQPGAVKWLSIGDGAAILGLGLALLLAHESDLIRRARRATVAETTLAVETSGVAEPAAVADAANGNGHQSGGLGNRPARLAAPIRPEPGP